MKNGHAFYWTHPGAVKLSWPLCFFHKKPGTFRPGTYHDLPSQNTKTLIIVLDILLRCITIRSYILRKTVDNASHHRQSIIPHF